MYLKGGVIMEKKPLIIRCSDGWIYGLFGYYEEAVEVAEQHIDGTEHVIQWELRFLQTP